MESKLINITKDGIDYVKYDNLYFINNEYVFLTTKKDIKLKKIYTMGGALDGSYSDRFTLLPIIKEFSTINELNDYINKYDFNNIDEVTCCLTHYWDHNISHALFDALYPIYLALLQFYSEENKFNIFVDIIKIAGWVFPGHASREYSVDIFKKFSKGDIIIKENNVNYKFSVMIGGSENAGISGVNVNGIMPGKEISALDKMRDRMFEVYNILQKKENKTNFTIINSSRYIRSETDSINRLNDYINSFSDRSCKIISWYDVKTFKEQLEIMSSTDIHISGAGSSMLNFPFLREGKIHINLGVNEINPACRFGKDHCTMPGLLEVNICLLPNTIFVDFYNIYKHESIKLEQMIELVDKNVKLLNTEKKTIVPNFVNKWKKMCMDNPEKMQQLIERMTYPKKKYPDLIPIRFMDVVVAQYNPYGNTKIVKDLSLI
jgi:hypothetical protein